MPPRTIAVALFHRDSYSTGHMRKVFGHEAFHWAIAVTPGQLGRRDFWSFEATDATEIDPVTFRMHNPTMSWWLRAQENGDPDAESKLIGSIVIGAIPDALSFAELQQLMTAVPLPIKNRHPQQSCVTWAGLAISALQAQEWVQDFDINHFKDWALGYGDERMKGEASTQPEVVTYMLADQSGA